MTFPPPTSDAAGTYIGSTKGRAKLVNSHNWLKVQIQTLDASTDMAVYSSNQPKQRQSHKTTLFKDYDYNWCRCAIADFKLASSGIVSIKPSMG